MYGSDANGRCDAATSRIGNFIPDPFYYDLVAKEEEEILTAIQLRTITQESGRYREEHLIGMSLWNGRFEFRQSPRPHQFALHNEDKVAAVDRRRDKTAGGCRRMPELKLTMVPEFSLISVNVLPGCDPGS